MNNSKKIFIIDDYASSKINGIGTYITSLVYILNTLNFEVYIIAYNYPCQTVCFKIYKNALALCIPILNISVEKYFEMICYFVRLNIEDSNKNIFMFNYIVSNFLLSRMKRYYLLSKFIYTVHDMSWTSFFQGDVKAFSKAGIRKILSENKYSYMKNDLIEEIDMFAMVDKIVALTNITSDLIQREYGISKHKISVIPNEIHPETPFFKKESGCFPYISNSDKVLLFVGRVHKSKGIEPLIDAFNMARCINKNIKLVILGALLPNESKYSITKDFTSDIIFRGFVERNEINAWYRIAYMAIFPSFYEQCSYAGLEMMTYQLPVVSSNGFCVNEMFIHNENAFIADIGDRNNLKEYVNNLKLAIIYLIDNQDVSNILAKNGKIKCDTIYNIQRVSNLYKLMFDGIFAK